MDGLQAAADLGEMRVDLWFLEDYNAERWECIHRFAICRVVRLVGTNTTWWVHDG
jgi:hypothetical protein